MKEIAAKLIKIELFDPEGISNEVFVKHFNNSSIQGISHSIPNCCIHYCRTHGCSICYCSIGVQVQHQQISFQDICIRCIHIRKHGDNIHHSIHKWMDIRSIHIEHQSRVQLRPQDRHQQTSCF